MSFNPFLRQIADAYITNEPDDLLDFCFVFPNKRSGTFFIKYLTDRHRELHPGSDAPVLLPAVVTISDLVLDWTDSVEASRFELLLLLFRCYRDIIAERTDRTPDEKGIDIDRFMHWGDMILTDFNDVDKDMVDAAHLFRNFRNVKEISANPLTPEQYEIVARFWDTTGNPLLDPEAAAAGDHMWNHLDYADKSVGIRNFLRLWEVLYDLYVEFRSRLSSRRLCYAGMASRQAALRLASDEFFPDSLAFRRYIFIGFNVLSRSEQSIFESLNRLGAADFYWDNASVAFDVSENRAARFIASYVSRFPSRYSLQPVRTMPRISVLGIPSNIGQAKEAADIISAMEINESNAISTAVVLPDESLALPLLHSLSGPGGSPDFDVNITMGYKLRNSPVAAMIDSVVALHQRERIYHGDTEYYHHDVTRLLSHPVVRKVDPEGREAIISLIGSRRLFYVPFEAISATAPAIAFLFSPISSPDSPDLVFTSLRRILMSLRPFFTDSELDTAFIDSYLRELASLHSLVSAYLEPDDLLPTEMTVLSTVDRIMRRASVSFIGAPLRGLQIMGMLETRCLDFDRIVITSMNERIFPRRHVADTFLPDSLRRAYGMATAEFQESIFAYYFYRLISRASEVHLLYDASTSGLKSGEMSRYIHQLRYIYRPEGFTMGVKTYPLHPAPERSISIVKTPEIMAMINRFRSEGPDALRFSASSLKKLLSCPLEFYLLYVRGMFPDDEYRDYLDDGTYGTIVHEVAEKIYKDEWKRQGHPPLITADDLDRLKSAQREITRIIIRKINKLYRGLGERSYPSLEAEDADSCLDRPLTGDAEIVARLIFRSVSRLLECEKAMAPFTFVQGEERKVGRLEVVPGLTVNLTQIIDRVDAATSDDGETYYRIIDYKTGSDTLRARSVADLFSLDGSDAPRAIMQLMLYCISYAQFNGFEGRIQPLIYSFREMFGSGIRPLVIDGEPMLDYRDLADEFRSLLAERLSSFFNPDVPISQCEPSPNGGPCRFCEFRVLCNR